MSDREKWDELHAELFDKLSEDCDRMAKEWADKHHIDAYQMAAQLMVQKEVYKRCAWSMRQPKMWREEQEVLRGPNEDAN